MINNINNKELKIVQIIVETFSCVSELCSFSHQYPLLWNERDGRIKHFLHKMIINGRN